MPVPSPDPPALIEIRKYSNRRFYDSTRSRHLTLEEIQDLIRAGHDVRVTDNQSGADITARVLTQIILDLDSPKLDLFPTSMLAQVIRVNDQLLKGFYERFFRQAFAPFSDYQKTVESKLKEGSGLPGLLPPMTAWASPWLNSWGLNPSASGPAGAEPTPAPAKGDDLTATVSALQRQIVELQAQLGRAGKRTKPATRSSKVRVGKNPRQK